MAPSAWPGTGEFAHYHSFNGATVAFTTGAETTWMFTDQISSTSLTHNEAGVNKTQRYTPWGETRTDGNLLTDHTYTGQIEDKSTGLRFYNARYQDPILGRFISADDRIPAAGSGQFYNRYSYNLNNPVNLTDSTGHEPEYAQHCYASPASCNPPAAAVTADELALSTKVELKPAWWARAYVSVSDSLPGGFCLEGAPGCDPTSRADQPVADLSAGVLNTVSGGLAENVWTNAPADYSSGWALIGGGIAEPATWNPISKFLEGVNLVPACGVRGPHGGKLWRGTHSVLASAEGRFEVGR